MYVGGVLLLYVCHCVLWRGIYLGVLWCICGGSVLWHACVYGHCNVCVYRHCDVHFLCGVFASIEMYM